MWGQPHRLSSEGEAEPQQVEPRAEQKLFPRVTFMSATSIRDFVGAAADPKVRGYLHQPETPNNDGLVLSHGAGSNSQAPLLIALAETFSAAGFAVLRCDLP